MSTSTRFITFVAHSLQWEWTKPCRTEAASHKAAENMVSARLMKDRGILPPSQNFGIRLRNEYPDIVKDSHQYIGETREIELPDDKTPKEFQRWFCTLQIDSDSHRNKTWQKEVA